MSRHEQAAWRELGEETGLGPDDVELVGEHDDWIVTHWPAEVVGTGKRLGQVHRWFEFRVRDETSSRSPTAASSGPGSGSSARWLVDHVVTFKRAGYARVLGTDG